MISKQQVKFIKSLQFKKYRNKYSSFLVEGVKSVLELLHSTYEVDLLVCTQKFFDQYSALLSTKNVRPIIEKENTLELLGSYQSNDYVLAVAKMKDQNAPDVLQDELVLALDQVRDPGNLGTIIRTADWYGIKTILANEGTADVFNPKVISATMGSFTRVTVYYVELSKYLKDQNHTVYGAFIDGRNIYEINIEKPAVILLGNESQGITAELKTCVHQSISIPKFGGAESLNVAISAGILCDHLRRPFFSA
ncbi:MAG: TrmH family RNA methyltransferase [Cyclobacteriaceae bacterium]